MAVAPQPQPLFEWRTSWPRWYGSPDDVAVAARKIDEEARSTFDRTRFRVQRDFTWHVVEPDGAERVAGSPTVDTFAIDLSVNHRRLKDAHVRVLVVDRSWPLPVHVEDWPTRPYAPPAEDFTVESAAAPVLVTFDLTPERGAELSVRSASGLSGDMLFMAVKPYAARGAGRLPHKGVYRGPVTWLLPRFELVDGQRRWLRVAAITGSIMGALGGLAGIVALLIA